MYTDKINDALQTAAILHKDQVRKGEEQLPYITHLVAVALIAMRHTKDEDIIVAALLHDTIEDTEYTPEELRSSFGSDVHDMVMGVTEPQDNADHSYSWKERKEAYANHLNNAPHGSLVVAAADKIHNMSTIIEQYKDNHTRFVMEFGGSLDDRVLMYQDIADTLNTRLENDILDAFNEVFSEYKSFISHVKESQETEG